MKSEYQILMIQMGAAVFEYESTSFSWRWSELIVEVWSQGGSWKRIFPMPRITHMTEMTHQTPFNRDLPAVRLT